MESFGEVIREARLKKDLSLRDLAELAGLDYSYIGRIEKGYKPSEDAVKRLANALNLSEKELLYKAGYSLKFDLLDALEDEYAEITVLGKLITPEQRLRLVRVLDNPSALQIRTIPILGKIKMGIPILAEENYDGELDIPSDIEADFALEARGNSMIGVGLLDGDWAICKQAQAAYSGDIVVALRDDGGFSEATLKYYFNSKEAPVLRAANPEYEDIPMSEGWRIAGVLVAVLRKNTPPYRVYSSYLAARDVNKEKWDPVFEKASQMGIEPEQIDALLEMIYRTAKR